MNVHRCSRLEQYGYAFTLSRQFGIRTVGRQSLRKDPERRLQ
jgi:hypothetical protein